MKGPTILIAALGLSIGMLGGCKRNIRNNDAVRQGVMTYLSKRADFVSIATMDVKVVSVTYLKDQALAVVRFEAKGNNSGSGLTMQYILERNGDLWVVKRKGTEGHGTAGKAQEGSGGSIGAMPQTMPPGHPTVGSGGLPAGHPPVGSDKKPGKSQ
ncbi:MAG TPA: hypothetical protein VIX89_09405 [Bryobacteraceae bacterium]